MAFQLIDLENWERREFYEHFIKEVVCTYSVVVNIDITNLKGQKLYPAMIWLLTKTVNDMPEFRTSLTPEGLGIYDDMHPMYTVFNKENKNILTYMKRDFTINKPALKELRKDLMKMLNTEENKRLKCRHV